MKTIRFDKALSIMVDDKKLSVNGAELLFDWEKVYEKQPLSKQEADNLLEWYEKQEDWNYSPEDLEEIHVKIKEVERDNKKEVNLIIEDKNILDVIKSL